MSRPRTSLSVWRWVTLHRARDPGRPEGTVRDGYHLHLPLDAQGRIDRAAWREHPDRGAVVRFAAEEGTRLGWLEHRAGGADGATWVIDYDETASADDEAGHRLDHHVFKEGEYVTLSGPTGARTYRIAAVTERAPLGVSGG